MTEDSNTPIVSALAVMPQVYAMFEGMMQQGFTRSDALYLIASLCSGGPKQPPDED